MQRSLKGTEALNVKGGSIVLWHNLFSYLIINRILALAVGNVIYLLELAL